MVGESLQALLMAQEDFSTDELADNQLHREVMSILVRAINSILSRDNHGGLEALKLLPGKVLINDSMLWVAAFWTAIAHRNAGNIDGAREASTEAVSLSRRLGARDRSTSLGTLAEIEYQSGNLEQADHYLEQAQELSRTIDDRRGQASARLAQARVRAAAGALAEAAFIAHNALVLDPTWPAPIVFLGRQAMLEGKLKKAERILAFLMRLEPRPPEAAAELGLLSVISSSHIPLRVLREYLQLEGALPGEEVVSRMGKLVELCPDFLHLREKLAWKLLHLGRNQEAEEHFQALAELELDLDMRSSVRLGLGTAVSQAGKGRETGKRLTDALRSVPPSLKPTPESRHERATRMVPVIEEVAPGLMEDGGFDEESLTPSFIGMPPPLPLGEVAITAEPPPAVGTPGPAAPVDDDQRRTMPFTIDEQAPYVLEASPPTVDSAAAAPDPQRTTMDEVDGRQAVFKGGLQHLGVPELLQFFHSSRMTGTLLISAEEGLGAVHFLGGMLAGAASPGCSNLGDLVVSEGIASAEQVAQATASQEAEQDSRLLGAILVDQGLATRAAVNGMLEKQVFLAIGEMMEWREGHFAFSPERGDGQAVSEVEIRLDPQMVLLDVLGGD